MPTAIVSGRVDAAVRDRANAYIHAAGLTAGDVVKLVWENIARTGEVPMRQEVAEQEYDDPFEQFMAFCASLPKPKDDWLSTMTDEQMKDLIAAHLFEKYA